MEKKKVKRFINMEVGIKDADLKDVVSIGKINYLGVEQLYSSKEVLVKYNPYFDLQFADGEVIRVVHHSYDKIPQSIWLQQPDRKLRKKTAKESLQFALKIRSKTLAQLKVKS